MAFSSQSSYVLVQKQRGFETIRRKEIKIGEERTRRHNIKNNIKKRENRGK